MMTQALDAPRFTATITHPAFTGVGPEAMIVRDLSEERRLARRTTVTMNLLGDAIECFNNNSTPNWDAEGAEAIRPGTLAEALQFIYVLPESLAMPKVLSEPDGGIAFEWYAAPHRVLVVSFKGKGLLIYAGIFGKGNTIRGAELFRNSLPNELLDHIRRVGEPEK